MQSSPKARRTIRAVVLTTLSAALLASCAINPVTKRPNLVMSSQKGEIEKAKQIHPLVIEQSGGLYDDPKLQAYVNEVGQRTAKASDMPNLEYTFTVIDSEDINAFTTGGGYVYVSRGLLSYLNSEAELAAVLGHEIGHITAHHPGRRQTGSTLSSIGAVAVGIFTGSGDLASLADYAGAAISTGYGRDMELEADQLGANYLAKAGLNPSHMIDVVRLLKNQELFEMQQARAENRKPRIYHGVFSTHPDNDTRLREVVEAAGSLNVKGDQIDPGVERYLKAIDGLPVGTSAAQGVLKENRLYHAGMAFTVAFPRGWGVENRADRIVAASPKKDSILQLTTQAPPPNTGPKELLGRLLASQASSQFAPLEVNGLEGYTAVVRNAKTPLGTLPTRYAVVYFNNLAYIFAGASKASSGTPSADPLFMSTIKTFRRLKDSEFAASEPYRLKLVQAADGMKIEDVAKQSSLKKYPVETLRLLNDLYPNKEPSKGQWIKTVQ